MVKLKFILLTIAIILLFNSIYGCAPAIMEKVQLQQIELNQTPPFTTDLTVPKPEKPVPIFLDGDFNKTDNSDSLVYFAFNSEEFAKIIQLSQGFDVQSQVIYYCLDIINKEISVNNDIKEMLGRKDMISQHFADLYINEQNLRLQENYEYKKEKFLDRIFLFIQSGVIIALIL
jgi:hypothetical protein